MEQDNEVQRSLGRIEGMLQQQQREFSLGLKSIRQEFSAHKQDDQRSFSSIRVTLKDYNQEREIHLGQQDVKLNKLELTSQKLVIQDENAKAIGKYILAFLGSIAALIGSAVVAFLTGHIKIT
jgi:hypothetical protein